MSIHTYYRRVQLSNTNSTDVKASWIDALRSPMQRAVTNDSLWIEMREYVHLIVRTEFPSHLSSKVGVSDVVQESLFEAQRHVQDFRGESHAELRAWLKKIAMNNIQDWNRRFMQSQKRSLQREVPLEETAKNYPRAESITASAILAKKEMDFDLLNALNRIDPDLRRLVELRHRLGLSISEIARSLGLSEHSIRYRLGRAIADLRRELLNHA